MSTEIFYFSGTGNSLHVARELQKRIPGTALVPLIGLLNRSNGESIQTHAETIGFVFPQYGSQMPKIVARAIDSLDLQSARYLFAIVTRGGTACHAFLGLDKILGKWGKKLDAFFVLTMPSGSEPLVKNYVQNITVERIARLETEMLSRLDRIVEIVTTRGTHRDEDLTEKELLTPEFMKPFLPVLKLLAPLFLPIAKAAESNFKFYVDSRCTGCEICEKVCLAQKIRMDAGKPVWLETVKCHGCFACLNYCPAQAVQIKSSWYLKSQTPQNGRYHHPQVTPLDIAAQK